MLASTFTRRCLEGLGHEVIVADPGFAPMYGTRRRRVKTDVRDARALRSRKPAALAVVRRPAPGQVGGLFNAMFQGPRGTFFTRTVAWPRAPRP